MDFLGFLEEEKDFLEFLNKRKTPPLRPAARDPRIPAAAGVPRGLRCGSASHWPAAADPAAAGVAGRGVGHRVARSSGGGPHQIPWIFLQPCVRVGSNVSRRFPLPSR
jgi:hypothetical protein